MTPDPLHPTSEDLFAYRDGELPAERRTLIEAHVLSCSQCRAHLDAMSAAEGALRGRPDDVDDAYFARMSDAVMERIGGKPKAAPAPEAPKAAPTGPEPAGSGGAESPGPARLDRRRPEPIPEEAPRRSRTGSWLGIVGSLAAAAAVVVVVVMLAQHQGDWVRAPRPGVLGEPGTSAKTRADRGAGTATETGGEAEGKSKAQTLEKDETRAPEAITGSGAAPSEPLPAPAASAPPSAERRVANEAAPSAGQANAPAEESPKPALLSKAAPPVATQRAADALGATGPVASGAAYDRVIREHGLPPQWNERVSRESLLGAESSLRSVYINGAAGPDSARIRLYLAEAGRLRLASPSDSVAVDRILHHYWRAVRLAGDDRALADLARRRLLEFRSEVGERP